MSDCTVRIWLILLVPLVDPMVAPMVGPHFKGSRFVTCRDE